MQDTHTSTKPQPSTTYDVERHERRSFRILLASSVCLVLALLLQVNYVFSYPALIDDAPFSTAALWLLGGGIVLYLVSMALAPTDGPWLHWSVYGKWQRKNL